MGRIRDWLAAGLVLAALTQPARATEQGASIYPQGPDFHLPAVLPPPGTYGGNTLNYYTADRFNDSDGNSVGGPDFHFRAIVNSLRVIHVTGVTVLGANLGMHTIVPLAHLQLESGGQTQRVFGLSNVVLSPVMLGWHDDDWHWLAELDVITPDFYWKPNSLNAGQGYWAVEPVFAVTHWDPTGGPRGSIKLMYDFNFTNPKSDYQSGQEFHLDFEGGWGFGRLEAGASGYYYAQTTDDVSSGVTVGDGNRGMAVAAGPMLRYAFDHFEIEGTWQHEFRTENRTQGDKIWLRVHFAF